MMELAWLFLSMRDTCNRTPRQECWRHPQPEAALFAGYCACRRHRCCLSGIAARSAVGRFMTTRGRFRIRARQTVHARCALSSFDTT